MRRTLEPEGVDYCKLLTKNEKVMNVGGISSMNLSGRGTEGISEAGD